MNTTRFILIAEFKSIKNILLHKMSKLTRIEMCAFVILLAAFFLNRVHIILDTKLSYSTPQSADAFFMQLSQLYAAALFLESLLVSRVLFSRPPNQFLFIQAIPVNIFYNVQQYIILTLGFILYLLWFGAFLIYIFLTEFTADKCIVLLMFSLLFTASLFVGINSALLRMTWKKLVFLIVTTLSTLILSGIILFLPAMISYYTLTTGFLLVCMILFSLITSRQQSKFIRKHSPERFYRTKKNSKKAQHPLLYIFIFFVPSKYKAWVKKDLLFAIRENPSYLPTVYILIFMMAAGIINQNDPKDAAGWFTFVSILSAYAFANLSFKFMSRQAEKLEFLRPLHLSPVQLWLAKFWAGFSAFLVIFLIGAILYLIRHHTLQFFPGAFGISLWAGFTLIYVETNFALHSYPVSRYAVLWYNIYLVTAILFFTIFLFPPLTIAFLLLGYFSIFSILKSINKMDLSDDQY